MCSTAYRMRKVRKVRKREKEEREEVNDEPCPATGLFTLQVAWPEICHMTSGYSLVASPSRVCATS